MLSMSSRSRAVPFHVPVGFVVVASAFLAWGAGLLALHPEALSFERHPLMLAAVHLVLLGFGVGVLMGAMHQLVPVIVEVALPWPKVGSVVLALWSVGLPMQVLGFVWSRHALLAVGGTLVTTAMLLFAVHMAAAYRSAPKWSPVATALAWVTLYLALTPLLGMLQAVSMRLGFYDPNRLLLHAVAGLVGVFVLSILGVGHKLVGMFTLSHGGDEKLLGLMLWTVNLGVLALAFRPALGAGLLAASAALALLDTRRILARRTKRVLDVGVRHYLVGLAFLVFAGVGFALGRTLLAGVWFGLGFVGLVVTGMLYKIVPFLVWLHRHAPRAGREKVPLLGDMYPERAANVAMVLLGVGALVAPLHPLGFALFALGVLPYAFALSEVFRS